VQQAGFDSLWI